MTSRVTAALIAATLLTACDSGPSESEYLAVCLKEGQTRADQGHHKTDGRRSGHLLQVRRQGGADDCFA